MNFYSNMLKTNFNNLYLNKLNLTDFSKIPQIRVKNNSLGELFTETFANPENPMFLTTFLKDKDNKVFGREIFSWENGNNRSAGFDIKIDRQYRQSGLHFGEILRLSSIMMMLKNGITEFEIFSKPEAVFFHSKYKFKPAIKSFKERDCALIAISKNCNKDFEFFKKEADIFLKEAEQNKDAEKQRNLCKKTNLLLTEYINKILSIKDGYKLYPFEYGFRMILSSDEIKQNKTFFNNLLKKYKVDYII